MKTSPPGGFLRKDSNPALRARLEGSIQKAQMCAPDGVEHGARASKLPPCVSWT